MTSIPTDPPVQDSGFALLKGLSKADAYNHPTESIRLIETHISWVLLTGQYAYKIKKPVNFGFLDFSALAQREFFCHEELRLNQRLAASWYLAVVPITGSPAAPKMAGTGDAIEYAVKMRQFPCAQTLRESAECGQLSTDEIDQIASLVADFHHTVARTDDQSPYGSSQDIRYWFTENFTGIRPFLKSSGQVQQLAALQVWGDAEWHSKAALMKQRQQQGWVRECHGDLHLGNMTLVDGKVIPFDCIEFNPLLSWIDVMSEVAFLMNDLLRFGYEVYAYRFLNRYLQATGDYPGLALLRYYWVYRALVRAKIALLQADQNPEADGQLCAEYGLFADLAERFTQPGKAGLIIMHGFSGSGKSTLASQVAENIGALQIRSDIERKRLLGYTAQADTGSGLGTGIYSQEASRQTYRHLAVLAKGVLEAGFSVIVDAAFLNREQREGFLQLAEDCQTPFIIIAVQAADDTLCQRIRQRQGDASEATVAVLRQQQQAAEPLGEAEQRHTIAVDTERGDALERVLTQLGKICP
ncbi:bifunctional aminoglycoside phosphotransferase/ATP-binding protein [Methylovulum psychrotolerans]|uniref:Aminoglycoside phosphotransferase n=1 Tax=Methylovulum psychrotolerans TaxID=1704499 RepID=A0A1Z4BVL0_9GAMM|nr:bifunctional aminoglycoside phosphotransferase/ATP-binding protein [Methylovulum psychrotolerans]ASF45326.1 aminoglycoside phosphotransferase [Methylovulum psychrotolerans]